VVIGRSIEFRTGRNGVRSFLLGSPLEQLTPTADYWRSKMVSHLTDGFCIDLIDAQHFARFGVVIEQVPNDLLVVTHSVFIRSVLG